MALRAALYTRLTSQTGVTNLVGTRIYPNYLPQKIKTFPAIWIEKISDPQIHNMGTDTTPVRPRYTIHCVGETYDNADDVRVQVKAALKDYSGTIGSDVIQRIFYEDEIDGYDGVTERHDLMIDFIIWADR